MSDEERPKLGTAAPDRVAALVRAGVGFVPLIGSALVEIVTEFVPNQRIDRVESYLRHLEQELGKVANEQTTERLKRPESIDLIEDGGLQAVRALSDDRRVKIARLVASGVTSADADALETKRILSIFGELDDGDIALLVAWDGRGGRVSDLRPSWNDFEDKAKYAVKEALYNASTTKLERFSMLNFRIQKGQFGNIELDTFSNKPRGSYSVTSLGGSILDRLGYTKITGDFFHHDD